MTAYLPYLAPFLFVGIFPLVLFALSRLGWHSLSQRYNYSATFKGKGLSIMGARINWVNYNGVLSISSNEEGLYIAPVLFFKLFHPPILIPWSAFTKLTIQKFWFIEQCKLSIGVDQFVKITIPKRGYNQIKVFLSHLD